MEYLGIDVNEICRIAVGAGQKILEVYEKDFNVDYKEDNSPLTVADRQSHEYIVQELSKLDMHYPILSEESEHISYDERKNWQKFRLVDPLDGTKEFIKRNGEFTVNIALIEDGRPVLGVIYVPVTGVTYYGVKGSGAYKTQGGAIEKLKVTSIKSEPIKVVVSRSHSSPAMQEYLDSLEKQYGSIEFISVGSSLKFCLVAEGKADIYPRLSPTMEWDSGAADIICHESGVKIYKENTSEVLAYNKENLLNPNFIVTSLNVE